MQNNCLNEQLLHNKGRDMTTSMFFYKLKTVLNQGRKNIMKLKMRISLQQLKDNLKVKNERFRRLKCFKVVNS